MLKQEGEAAPSRTAPSAASLTGTRSPACRPPQTCVYGVPTTFIPRGESTRPSGHFLCKIGHLWPQLSQIMGDLELGPELVRSFLLKMKQNLKLSWQQSAHVCRDPSYPTAHAWWDWEAAGESQADSAHGQSLSKMQAGKTGRLAGKHAGAIPPCPDEVISTGESSCHFLLGPNLS